MTSYNLNHLGSIASEYGFAARTSHKFILSKYDGFLSDVGFLIRLHRSTKLFGMHTVRVWSEWSRRVNYICLRISECTV